MLMTIQQLTVRDFSLYHGENFATNQIFIIKIISC